MKRLAGLVLALLGTASMAQDIIRFQAWSNQNLNPVRAALFLPDRGPAPHALIITQHGSSPDEKLGRCDFAGKGPDCIRTDTFSLRILRRALEQGFAVAVIDAFTDIGASKDNKLGFPNATSYAHTLRDQLAQDPRLDSDRFFYTGWSYGGQSVINTIARPLPRIWKAIAPVEAGCQFQPAARKLPYPSLFVMAEKSHYPPGPCLYLHEQLLEAGSDSKAVVIPKADHHFSLSPASIGPGTSLNGCTDNFVIITGQSWRFKDGTPTNPREAWARCATGWGAGGGPPHKLDEAVGLVIDFFISQR